MAPAKLAIIYYSSTETLHRVSAGGVLVPLGYTDNPKSSDGNPCGVSHVTGGSNDDPLGRPRLAAQHRAERLGNVSTRLRVA